jgi:transposase
MMRINDGRKLNREAQAQIRITAVQRVLDGESSEEVIKSIGCQRRMIYQWLAQYRIKDETPEQYTFDFVLWTIETIREVIQRLFQVTMSVVSVWRTLKALGLSAQRPRHVAYQQMRKRQRSF